MDTDALKKRAYELLMASLPECGDDYDAAPVSDAPTYADSITTPPQLAAFLQQVHQLYQGTPIPRATGSYYLCCATEQPHYLITALYLLLASRAKLYIEVPRYGIALFSRLLVNLIASGAAAPGITAGGSPSQEHRAFLDSHRDIRHFIILGNCINQLRSLDLIARKGLTLHLVGSVLVLVDYDSAETAMTDVQLFHFGDLCYEGCMDYIAFRSKANQQLELYSGFDFCDRFSTLRKTIRRYLQLKAARRDKPVVIVFTDRPHDALGLPKYYADKCTVVFPEHLDLNGPLYDFSQLLPKKRHSPPA